MGLALDHRPGSGGRLLPSPWSLYVRGLHAPESPHPRASPQAGPPGQNAPPPPPAPGFSFFSWELSCSFSPCCPRSGRLSLQPLSPFTVRPHHCTSFRSFLFPLQLDCTRPEGRAVLFSWGSQRLACAGSTGPRGSLTLSSPTSLLAGSRWRSSVGTIRSPHAPLRTDLPICGDG